MRETDMSLRKRIFIPIIVLAAGCAIAAYVFSMLVSRLEIDKLINDKVNIASMLVEHEIENLKINAYNAAIALARDPALIEALSKNNREQIINTLTTFQALPQVDFCTILDKEGFVITRMHHNIYGDSLAHLPHVIEAMKGDIKTYVVRGVTIPLGAYAGAPVFDRDMNMVGIVSLGYRLDAHDFLIGLKIKTGCEISVFLNDELIGTTLFDKGEAYLPEAMLEAGVSDKVLAGEAYVRERQLRGKAAVEKILPIKGVSDEPVGMIGVIYFTDKAQKLFFHGVGGALMALVVLLASIIVSRLIYGQVEHRLENLMNEVREAAENGPRALEEKNMRANLENIINGLDTMIYATKPKTGEILFINDCMKRHYGLKGDCVGQLCYKILQNGLDGKCDFCPCFQLDEEPGKTVVWEERSTLTNRIYRNIDRYIDWPDGQKVHLQHSVDETELVAAKEAAERASHYKSGFLASMSHEIRTPMNAILGIAEIQLMDKKLPPEMKEAFNKIFESGELLLGIVNDILDLSKIEAGKLELVPVKYDIPSLIHGTVPINLLRHEKKPILFSLHVDENTPQDLYGDELRIKQILNNILSNAFKYTEKGSIELSVSAEPGQGGGGGEVTLVFSVRDTGQGMTEKQVASLFDEYTRFNVETNRAVIGAGLGMSIVKRLVDMMKGDIKVESELNKGSIFTVRLPQKRIGSEVCGADLVDKLRNFNDQGNTIPEKLKFLREYMPYGSVLVVDDVDLNLYVTKGMLKHYGLKVETASSGFEAIEKIKSGKVYDLVFMDHLMPKMDGLEATKILRDMGYTHNIVALTANALLGREEMFLQNGFDGFISKPIDPREMNILLNNFIRNKKAPEALKAARREQGGNEPVNMAVSASNMLPKSEIDGIFVLDAENAMKAIGKIYKKIDELDEKEMESYIIAVHGIKSALANIGETELSKVALRLEKAAIERDIEVMAGETPAFMEALYALIKKLKGLPIKTEAIEPR